MLDIDTELFSILKRVWLNGDLTQEDLSLGLALQSPAFKFSMACKIFGLARDIAREAAYDKFVAVPTDEHLQELLVLCHVACACTSNGVEVYRPDRSAARLTVLHYADVPVVSSCLSQGYDAEYLLTPDAMATLVLTALSAN